MNGDPTETVSKTVTGANDSSADDEAPRLIVICEYGRLIVPALRIALGNLQEVTVGRDSLRGLTRDRGTARLAVPDHQMSRKHLAVRRQSDGWRVADLGSKNGFLLNGEPASPTSMTLLKDGDLIEAGGTLLMFCEDGGGPDGETDRDLAAEPATPIAFLTVSSELEHRVRQLTKIARTNVAVLIRGETGTGKELIARAVHDASARRGPFIAINCGALPRNLIENELFGHKRGAFSGAHEERDGLVRRAHGGTLFLDEIAELPEESQVALLRVLQDGEVRPIGASDAVKVDIRIVAATHQDIPARIADGRFRQDLYARLAGFEMALPALRDRREDLGTLIAAILPRVATHPQRITLHRSAARALFRYGWPLKYSRARAGAACRGRAHRHRRDPPRAPPRSDPDPRPSEAHDQARRPRVTRAPDRAPPRAWRQCLCRGAGHGKGAEPDPTVVQEHADRAVRVSGLTPPCREPM